MLLIHCLALSESLQCRTGRKKNRFDDFSRFEVPTGNRSYILHYIWTNKQFLRAIINGYLQTGFRRSLLRVNSQSIGGLVSKPSRTPSFSTTSIFDPLDTFARRHVGPEDPEIATMCRAVGVDSLDALADKTLPAAIKIKNPTRLGPGLSETEAVAQIKRIAAKNKLFKSYIGMGYTNSITPYVILRNVMENPLWYTQVKTFLEFCLQSHSYFLVFHV